MMKNYLSATALAILLCLGSKSSSFGATATVLVGSGGNVFVPALTNINAGDQVTWKWIGSFHSTTSTNSTWPDSSVQNSGFMFSHTFSSSGTFGYYCTIHGTPTSGMKGAIVVAAPNSPPTVSITNPAANAVFAAPANVTIQASATDSDGSVTNVQFLIGSTVVANSTAAPYSTVTNNLAAGAYTLSAVASDNKGAKATNTVAISVVTAVAPTISGLQQSPPANFQFSYSANVGLHYVVERSADLALASWIAISTNTAASDPQTFVDANATNNPGFYRVRLLPNP
ncbi:MAG: Ig-like domain-containing protein [Limisphaerales bacterium]